MRRCESGPRPRQRLVYEIDVMLEGHSAGVHTKRMADALGESASRLEPAKRDRRANRASGASPRETTKSLVLAFVGIAGVWVVAPCPDRDAPDQLGLAMSSSPSFHLRLR